MSIEMMICSAALDYALGVIIVAAFGSLATKKLFVINVSGITITITLGAAVALFLASQGVSCYP